MMHQGVIGAPLCLAFLVMGVGTRADDPPPASPAAPADPFGFIDERPISLETWPLWREVYLRTFFEDMPDPKREEAFHKHVMEFLLTIENASDGSLPDPLAKDPIAWSTLGWAFLHKNVELRPNDVASSTDLVLAEHATRRAIALGDPNAIVSYTLAVVLIEREFASSRSEPGDNGQRPRLIEAEALLRATERISPNAIVDVHLGQIAQLRGDKAGAIAFFRSATEKHPTSERCAHAYLMAVASSPDAPVPLIDLTGPFVARFPDSPGIEAIHAVALHTSGRYLEASEAIQHARDRDEKAVRFLGDNVLKRLDEGRYVTPEILEAEKAIDAKHYAEAASILRRVHAEVPSNPIAARELAIAISHDLTSPRQGDSQRGIREVEELCRQFPDDPEMQGALAFTLHSIGRDIEAARALDRIEELGADPKKFFDPALLFDIQRRAHSIHRAETADESLDDGLSILLVLLGVAAAWIAAMFAVGAILAICIPRIPAPTDAPADALTSREVWLERFYLLALSLGLLGFYISVPIVALGLLVVTLAMFGLLAFCRIIHLGVLHRGMWATWNVLRSAVIGPPSDVLGIEATREAHPHLFATIQAVADRLHTRPVDSVYLTPSASVSVHQEGSGPFGLFGERRRVLQIGISTLILLDSDEFEAILAHEYGHFSRSDPLYGRLIFQVSASLAHSLAVMNAAGGFITYINPFFWFWWLYLRAYTLLSTGFSRSREFLADRRAAAAYGKQAFVSGLTKVTVDGQLFEFTAHHNIRDLLGRGMAFSNVFDAFRHFREGADIVESRERLLEEIRRVRPRWLDTHPTYSERIAAVASFPDDFPPADTTPALHLLTNPEAVEAELTSILTNDILSVLTDLAG